MPRLYRVEVLTVDDRRIVLCNAVPSDVADGMRMHLETDEAIDAYEWKVIRVSCVDDGELVHETRRLV